MKKNNYRSLILFAVCVITSLSLLYLKNEQEPIRKVSASASDTPLTSIPTDSQTLALTFDLNFATDNPASILKLLNRNQIHATFFITGNWLEAHTDMAEQLLQDGHEIGNHTMTHPELTFLSSSEQEKQITDLHNTFSSLTGTTMTLFRPPYGSYNSSTLQAATNQHYTSITWSIDSEDWKDYDSDTIISTICNHPNLSGGSILLFQTQSDDVIRALKTIIPTLKKEGYTFDTVSSILSSIS